MSVFLLVHLLTLIEHKMRNIKYVQFNVAMFIVISKIEDSLNKIRKKIRSTGTYRFQP